MAMKVDHAAAAETQSVQTTVASSTPSAISASSTKVSMFGAKKSGFVIPKNKLSGALVPIFRASGKADATDNTKEDTTKQVQRKTKWGIDITQDATVRRGRSLAYQTRVEQIMRQLKARVPEVADDEGLQSTTQDPNDDSAGEPIDEACELELLELEKREAIGEILRLNPNYKAPPDYKPLLKEAKVPIPLKAFPGYNFIGLILGTEGKTQKRLEEETGAKIRIHGTKSDTGEEKVITQPYAQEAQDVYEELSVHISAETYEKVDAAVALIELLVTPVSGNVVPASATSALTSVECRDAYIQDSATGFTMPPSAVNQGLLQPLMGPGQVGPPGVHFQPYPGAWQPHAPAQMLTHPSSGFNSASGSTPMLSNPVQFPLAPINPFNGQLAGARPPTAGYGSFVGNSTVVSAPQPQSLNPMIMSRPSQNYPMLGPQAQQSFPTIPARASISGPVPTANQPVAMAQMLPTSRPPGSSMTQHATTRLLGPHPVPSLGGNMFGWPGQPPNMLTPFRPPNTMTMQMANPAVQSQRPLHGGPIIVPGPTQHMPGATAIRTPVSTGASQHSGPQSAALAGNNTNLPVSFTSGPSHSGASSAPILASPPIHAPLMAVTSSASAPSQAPPLLLSPAPRSLPMPVSIQAPSPGLPPLLGQPPISRQVPSAGPMQPTVGRAPIPMPSPSSQPAPVLAAGSVPSFSSIKPPIPNSSGITLVTTPKPQRPSSSDFTFQPHRPQIPAAQNALRPSNDPISHSAPVQPTSGIQPPPAPQGSSFRPVANNSTSPLGMPSLPRPLPQAPIPSPNSASFPINQSTVQLQPRLTSFVNPHPAPPTTPAPQMLPRYSSAPRVPIASGPLSIQPGNQFRPMNRPGSLMVQNLQHGSNLSYGGGRPASNPGGAQFYDPFSPTGVPQASSQQGGGPEKGRKPEMDTEYEDLMASVGVR